MKLTMGCIYPRRGIGALIKRGCADEIALLKRPGEKIPICERLRVIERGAGGHEREVNNRFQANFD